MIFSATTVAGHRGWPFRYPDNTLAGIGAAYGVTDLVEVDVRRTMDDGGSVEDAARHAASHGHRVVAPHHSLLSASDVDRLHNDSLEIVAWTVNDLPRALELAGMGVEVLVTDDPGSIVSVLEEQR